MNIILTRIHMPNEDRIDCWLCFHSMGCFFFCQFHIDFNSKDIILVEESTDEKIFLLSISVFRISFFFLCDEEKRRRMFDYSLLCPGLLFEVLRTNQSFCLVTSLPLCSICSGSKMMIMGYFRCISGGLIMEYWSSCQVFLLVLEFIKVVSDRNS